MSQISYVNDLINSTWEIFAKNGALKDQVFDKYPIFERMNGQNRVVVKGGDRIKANLEVATTPVTAISGYERFGLNPLQLTEVIEYAWKEAVANVIFSQKELTQNVSEQQIYDLVETKMKNLLSSYPLYLNTQFNKPLNTVASNEVHSINQFIKIAQTGGTDDPSGLDRDTATYWRNQVVDFANLNGSGSRAGAPATTRIANSHHLMMIDEGCLKFYINSGGDFEQLPMERIGSDQVAWAKTVYFQGNLFMTGVRSSGLMYNIQVGDSTNADYYGRASNDLRDGMSKLLNNCTFNGERKPTIAYGTQEVFEAYETLAFNKRQFTAQSMADLTFDNFAFRGIPFTWDRLFVNTNVVSSL